MKTAPDVTAAKETARVFLQPPIADPDRGRAMVLQESFFDAAAAHFDAESAAVVVRKAVAGDKMASEAVLRAVAWYIEIGERVPDVLAPFAVTALNGELPRGKRTHNDNALRDDVIRMAVKAVAGHGFDRTRNEATRDRPSACSIVAEVLAEIDIHMTESNVASICDRVPE